MDKVNAKISFENCSIPAVLEYVVLLPRQVEESIISFSYCSDPAKADCFHVNEASSLKEFMLLLQREQMRIYQLIKDGKADPESKDIDYAFSFSFDE